MKKNLLKLKKFGINLLKKQKVRKIANIIGSKYKLHIASGSLAKYLCRGLKGLDISDLEYIDIIFDLDDALFSTEHFITIDIASEYRVKVEARGIKYDDGNPSDILPVKEAIKIIKNNIANSKYLQDLETVKYEFMKHAYIRK